MPVTDDSLWAEYAQSVQPLAQKKNLNPKTVPPRLKVRKTTTGILLNTLDLHGKTLEEAYRLTKTFFDLHFKNGTKQIGIITGKGLNGTGKIKNEIELWFETPFFKEKINAYHWENDGGVLRIRLKRQQKK